MEGELLEQLRAGRYRRTELRRSYRNGCRSRRLLTELGLVEHLRVPRDREGRYRPTLVKRYPHSQEKVNQLIRDMFLAGVSTRRVGEVLSPVLGESPSPQTVSRVARSLDAEVQRFHRRPLSDHYRYLLLDGITLKVKGALGAKKRLVLCAYGITQEGRREMVSFRQATAESEAQWEAFLQDLYQRGLEGKTLALVIRDSNPGLCRALEMVYPYVPQQRCWVHKLRNVATKLPKRLHKPCLSQGLPVDMSQSLVIRWVLQPTNAEHHNCGSRLTRSGQASNRERVACNGQESTELHRQRVGQTSTC